MSLTRLRRDLKYTLVSGLVLAAFLSAIAVAQVLGGKSTTLRELGLPLWALVLSYFLAGAVGGTILGFALPITRHVIGAVIIGMVIGSVVAFVLAAGYSDFEHSWKSGIVLGSAFGGPLGFYVWYLAHKERPRW
jgi:hypothetical protein